MSGQGHADGGVQLVYCADRFDARVGLRDPAEVSEVGLAVVTEPGVDPGQVNGHSHGLQGVEEVVGGRDTVVLELTDHLVEPAPEPLVVGELLLHPFPLHPGGGEQGKRAVGVEEGWDFLQSEPELA